MGSWDRFEQRPLVPPHVPPNVAAIDTAAAVAAAAAAAEGDSFRKTTVLCRATATC